MDSKHSTGSTNSINLEFSPQFRNFDTPVPR